ncbi:tetratricopeptide repeat protein [Caldibacillus lycopersici]|uniref:Tetratricopeptide repeat protein n=1 Tax=Perspicuibacillus lycopersici TaxID=1325689 RepID=A0AAE3LLX8_9BACI|nr:tetratricopeptide repeat protein [Perspicuibacillus lycopersici]MCU9612925.1 tetratricopeptide repeat protein [Perspicuibacillus lycopersici]
MSKNISENGSHGNVLTFYPNGEFYFTKGVKAFQRNDFLLAKKYLNRALQLEPSEPVIACQLAITLSELEEYDESNQILYKIIKELDQGMYECHYFLANNYAYMGKYKDAIHSAKLYLDRAPDGDFANDTLELLEVISFEDDDLEDDLFPQEPLLDEEELIEKQDHARQLLAEGNFTEAILLLQTIMEGYPEFWPAYNNLALAYYYNGAKEKAKSIVQDVLEKNPGNLHAMCNLTVFSYYEGLNIQSFVTTLEKVHPISIDHRYKLGVTFALIGEYEQGYKWLKTLLGLSNTLDASFYYWFAYAAYYVNKEALAEKVWKKLVQMHPEKEGQEPWKGNHTPSTIQ